MAKTFWDKYEVALLIDSCLRIRAGEVSRAAELSDLSKRLRCMATNQGIDIDDVYRNINGMRWQLGIIEAVLDGEAFESRQHPPLFVEMVQLFRSDRANFYEILHQAYEMVQVQPPQPQVEEEQQTDNIHQADSVPQGNDDLQSEHSVEELLKEELVSWLQNNNLSQKTVNNFIGCFERVSEYANQHGICRCSFWLITDYKQFNAIRSKLSGFKVFRLTMKNDAAFFEKVGKLYVAYLKNNEEHIAEIVKVKVQQKSPSDNPQEQHISDFDYKEEKTETTPQKNEQDVAIINEPAIDNKPSSHSEETTAKSAQQKIYTLTLSNPGPLLFSCPCYVSIYGQELTVPHSWKDVYVEILHWLKISNPTKFAKDMPISTIADDGIHIESNLNTQDIVRRIVWVLQLFKVPLFEVVIKYVINHEDTEETAGHNGLTVASANNIDKESVSSEEEKKKETTTPVALQTQEYVNTKSAVVLTDKKQEASQQGVHLLVLSNPGPLTFTSPCYVSIDGRELQTVNTWRGVYIEVLRWLQQIDSTKFARHVGTSFTTGARADLEREAFAKNLRSPALVANGIYAETNLSARDIACKMAAVLKLFNVPFSKVVIKYVVRSEVTKEPTYVQHNKTGYLFNKNEQTHSVPENKPISRKVECPSELKQLLLKNFPYGIRPDSSIDIMKLRGFAEVFGVELSDDDELLKTQIAAGGDSFEGKIYFIADDIITELMSRVQAIFDTGVCAVYYEKLYDHDFSWLDEHHVSSAEQLRVILKSHMTKVFCGENFVCTQNKSITELEVVEGEFKRIWGDNVIHTYDEIYGLLPYIPEEKIRFYLSRSYVFVWSSNETFAWLDKISITNAEKEEILGFVSSECETRGFASISNVPLESVMERNYEISITAIHTAVFRIVLDRDFKIKGKIITAKDKTMDALTLTKAYCGNKRECTFDELNDYVISITGASGRQTAFQAGYDMLVRVSKDMFVADSSVNFNVEVIDEILDNSISGDFIQINGIATFVMFPSCGYTWNHYVLESFCYRFSRKYRLEVINFNDKNAGIIVKKDCTLSYSDMLASAVANTEIALTEENVGRYLCDNGYTAKSKMTILREVTEKAQELRRYGE